VFSFKSRLLKFSYGLNIDGEVGEGGGTSGQGKEIEGEMSEPWQQHKTGPNPVNLSRDSEAEEEFPEIINPSSRFPTRTK
jgi:hypothetical protein